MRAWRTLDLMEVRLTLTPRETQVLALVLRGRGNKEIAAELGIAEQSVKKYVSDLLQKFDVPNRAALAEAGTRMELTGEPGVDRGWVRQLFFEAEPHICVLRGPELRYEAVNEAFRRAVGNRPTIGRTMREAFPELEGQGIFERVERVYATGEPFIEHEATRRWDRGRGIESRTVDLILQPLRDEDDRVNGVVSFGVDVTHLAAPRRRADFLREELDAVLDLAPSGVVVVDARGDVVRVNEAAQRIALKSLEIPIALALAGEATADQELTCMGVDPACEIRVRASVRPLRDPDGRIRGAIAVFTELDDVGARSTGVNQRRGR
jgi:DNA-binding CsgD family transcriptional regulator